MIKFFRKIRQNLIAERKTSKYMKYAIGEIILVVIGILIALQINNWNESRKESIKERQLLSNLKVEFEDNLKNLDSIAGEVDNVIDALEKVFDSFGTATEVIAESSLDSMISKALFSPNWRPSVYLLQNLSNSGSISDLKNKNLKILLYNWSRLRNQMVEVDVRTEKTGEEIIAYLKTNASLRNIDVSSKEFNYKKSLLPVNNLKLLTDTQFENYIGDKLYMYGTTRRILQEARDLLVQLIEETEH